MGHVVLNVDSIDRLLPFYRDVLGFGVSDYGLEPYPLYFFHVNARHHSFAMVGSGRSSIHHFMECRPLVLSLTITESRGRRPKAGRSWCARGRDWD
jgi:catechol 2,3-dioxygenase-like lactoylglutathione lyase family enzyme